jgi:hypothetical protein
MNVDLYIYIYIYFLKKEKKKKEKKMALINMYVSHVYKAVMEEQLKNRGTNTCLPIDSLPHGISHDEL